MNIKKQNEERDKQVLDISLGKMNKTFTLLVAHYLRLKKLADKKQSSLSFVIQEALEIALPILESDSK